MGLEFIEIKKLDLSKKISNRFFLDKIETTEEWIKTRTGIENRYYSESTPSEMAVELAKKIKIHKKKLKLILVASFTSDLILPSVAGLIHKELELEEDCLALDINMACTGFVGAMILGERFLKKGEQGLIIATEKISEVLDPTDRRTSILFGDGCAGALVEKNEKRWETNQKTFGNEEALYEKKGEYLQMQGREVYRFAVEKVPKSIEELLERSKVEKEEIQYIVAHQANGRILKQIAKKTEISQEKFLSNVEEYGNTSAASIPILLAESYKKFQPGDKILFSAFGAGLSICSVLMEW
ncbi:ketoacyl-ACP synthase III [Peptoniphilus sp. KCTC 25270]|uniref:ketoacyl-ACP synthase III n=1 Tax=Peptoniphilus sp. KCTC 25270 TaxID=2897414 RepID=UPI001E64DD82|nr:ketoacyl-ACP synthase III [Peptoniphilus sp. KCTC 25270]MCD1147711.1 ketoacyl-ACP synthase III [Peptoniphilus sp. KCTC 25270]